MMMMILAVLLTRRLLVLLPVSSFHIPSSATNYIGYDSDHEISILHFLTTYYYT